MKVFLVRLLVFVVGLDAIMSLNSLFEVTISMPIVLNGVAFYILGRFIGITKVF